MNPTYRISGSWVARNRGPDFRVVIFPWTMSSETYVTSPPDDPDNLHANDLLMSGDGLFWRTSTLKIAGLNVWDPVGGTRPFIRWVGDYTKGAAGLGTLGLHEGLARQMARDAGFRHFEPLDLGHPMNAFYVVRP